jgi:archaellum biogenesis ATPase FlaH
MYKFAISTETVVRSLSQITGIRYRESYKEYQFNECPYCHTKQKQKFAVNKSTGQFQCFRASCSAKGNLYTLAKDFEIDLGREINEYYGIGEQRHYRMFKKELTEKIEPTDTAMNYLNSRGISSEVVRKYKITTNKDNNIVFPFIDQSGVMQFVKYRNPSPEEGQSKEWAETNCKPILFGMHQCNLENKTLIVTEGQIDSLSVVEAGYENAVSVPTGKNGFSWTPYCWDWMQNFEKIIVFGDHENNNITLLKEFTDRWSSKVWHVREEDYKDCKDANEILQKYGAEQIKACVENAEQLPLSNVINLNDVEYIDPYEIPKIKTGIKVVDRLLCGGLPLGQMVLLTGKAGDGKSTLASQLLVNALDQGFKCFAYSGELPNYLFRSWIDFQAAGSDNVEERTSLWQPEPFFAVKEDIKKKIGAWYDRKFWLYDNHTTPTDGENHDGLIELVEKVINQYGVKVILLDNLMTGLDLELVAGTDKYDQQSIFVKRLVRIALDYNVLILLVAHKKKGLDAVNESVSGSLDIVNIASIVLSYERGTQGEIEGYWSTKKNENGEKKPHFTEPIMNEEDRKLKITKNRLFGKIKEDGFVLKYDPSCKRVYESEDELNYQYSWIGFSEVQTEIEDFPF